MHMRGQVFQPDTFDSDFHYATDYQEARRILEKFETDSGRCCPNRVEENLVESMYRAHNVIAANRRCVEEVAEALVAHPILNALEIESIIQAVDDAINVIPPNDSNSSPDA
jgi:hypothetical protein